MVRRITFEKGGVAYRICNKCNKTIPLSFFHKDKSRKPLGYSYRCKKCDAIYLLQKVNRHREHWRSLNRKYYRTDKGRANYGRKRAKRLQNGKKSINASEIAQVWAKTKNECWYCGVKLTTEKDKDNSRHRDHYKALDVGGADTAENCVPACRTCNLEKSTTPGQFYLADRMAAGKPVVNRDRQ